MFTDRKQKTIKLQTKNHKIKYGFINKKRTDSIYINIGSWVKINETDEELDYPREFRKINKEIKQLIYASIDPKVFDVNNFIVDLDIRQNGLSHKLKSYMNCEITLFKNNGVFDIGDELNKLIVDLINLITEKPLQNNKNFNYTATK